MLRPVSAHEVAPVERPQRGGPRISRAIIALAVGAVVVVATIALAFGASAVTGPATSAALPAPRFVEEALAAGIEHAYEGEYTFFVGGGVAAFDCDGDRRPELYFAGGSAPAALFRNRTETGGALRFERAADPVTDLTSVTGAYPLDIDGDRLVDLVVLRRGENMVLRGLGECRFEHANQALGMAGGEAWTVGFSATWETPTATLPTLAFGDYVTLDERESAVGCPDNQLIRPTDSGTVYAAPVALSPGWCTLSLLFSDWDRSGRRDLRVSNDRHYYQDGEEQLWRIEPGQPPREYRPDDGWARLQVWGMGIASQDLTGDGYPEVYLTSQGDNKLQTLADGPARPTFEDIALRRGVTAHRPFAGGDVLPSTAWHAEFDDVNADGYMDLFVAKGNVEAQTEYATKDPNNLLIGQPDGTFVEGAEAAGLLGYAKARGATLTDLDLDGMLDLVVVNRRENVMVWRNVGSGTAAAPVGMGGWIQVRLSQDGPNPDAIGVMGGHQGRGSHHRTGADRRWWACQRGARLDARGLGVGGSRRGAGALAGRGTGAVAAARGGPVRHHRARRDGDHAVVPVAAMTLSRGADR